MAVMLNGEVESSVASGKRQAKGRVTRDKDKRRQERAKSGKAPSCIAKVGAE